MYTTLDIAYNDNTAELDKMAREINNKKKTLFKTVENDYFNKQKKWENDIIEYNNSYKNPYGHFTNHPEDNININTNNNNNINTNKTKSKSKSKSKSIYTNNADNISSNTDTDFSVESNEESIGSYGSSGSYGSLGSMGSMGSMGSLGIDSFESLDSLESLSIDSPSLDSYIESVKKQPHKKRSVHSFIKKLDNESCSKNEDDIFTHVKYCYDCREKLLKYMKKEVKNKNNKNNRIIDYLKINKDSLGDSFKESFKDSFKESIFNYSETLEIKEIFLIIMLGIILIIFIDFLIKSPYSIR